MAGLGLIVLAANARAADLLGVLPTKAPPPVAPAAYDWTGFYLGANLGYALGGSNWSATQAGAATPSLGGTLSFSNAYNFSSGTGSYLLGFQAGYDYMAASRWLIGVDADVSFPSFVGGNTTLSSPPTGTANYLDRVEFSGTLRGRVGYAPNLAGGDWLFYATGGLAFSYDQFTRTQLAGVPVGGTAVPGQIENLFLVPRRRRGGRRRRRSRSGVALDRAARISVHRLRQSQRHIPGRRPAFRFRSHAQRIARRAELSLQ